MKTIAKYAKENRKKKTPAELELFKLLRRWNIKFRTQRMIDYYIVDFLIPDRWLVIELDGAYHSTRTNYDKRRDNYLRRKGFTIVRFINEAVWNTPNYILEAINKIPLKPKPENIMDLYGTSKY